MHIRSSRVRSLGLLTFSVWLAVLPSAALAQKPAAAPADPLHRTNPRAAVTGFLEACHASDYARAAQYLDLSQIPARERAQRGPQLARELQAILNSEQSFNVLKLSQDVQGNLTDDPNPAIEHVVKVTSGDASFTLDLQRVEQDKLQVWLFSPQTVREIPALTPEPAESAIEARLPRFLVSITPLETPLWKWIALLLLALLTIAVFRLLVRLLELVIRTLNQRLGRPGKWGGWLEVTIEPLLVLAAVMGFVIVEHLIAPSALSRLYIGRALLLVVVWAIAWGTLNLLELALARIDSLLNSKQRIVSHSLIFLARRAIRVLVVIFAIVVILSNWGYDMTTIIAGLGVGGIAVALAAQQTIANVFGGVSVIGDNPVMIGDSGNFGGLIGRVEDIGMRSTRVRTPARSVVSVPNASFAGMNLENYSVRDKILFNPTLQVKRTNPKDHIRRLIQSLHDMLAADKMIERDTPAIRITGYTSAAFALEIAAYVLTTDNDTFYKLQTELFLKMDDLVAAAGIELA